MSALSTSQICTVQYQQTGLKGERCNNLAAAQRGKDQQTSTSDLPGITLKQNQLNRSTERLVVQRNKCLGVRVSQLPLKVYQKICGLLSVKRELEGNDFRLLGEMLKLEMWQLRVLDQRSNNPTDTVLQRFDSVTDGAVRTFVGYLERMGRKDVIDAINEWINKSCQSHNTYI